MVKCACQGDYLDKFIQPAVLVLLVNGPSHGFRLLAELKARNILSGSDLDPAGFYRTLKKMETAGLLTSRWEDKGAGKPRRVFTITPRGRSCLKNWRHTLAAYRASLNVIADAVGAALACAGDD